MDIEKVDLDKFLVGNILSDCLSDIEEKVKEQRKEVAEKTNTKPEQKVVA